MTRQCNSTRGRQWQGFHRLGQRVCGASLASRAAACVRDAGFSLVEVLLATTLTLVVFGSLWEVTTHAERTARAGPAAVDLSERSRVAADLIARDLYVAGAGLDEGPRAGPLGRYVAAVLPRRVGGVGADAPEAARADAITLLWVPDTHVQSHPAAFFSGTTLTVGDGPGCPATMPACGVREDAGLLVFDRTASADLFRVIGPTGSTISLAPRVDPSGHEFGTDAAVAEIEARTYYLDPTTHVLRMSAVDSTDVPVVDGVVGFGIEYFGTPEPPQDPKPPPGVANCLYDEAGVLRPGLATLAPVADGLASLPLAMLADGPWCGAGGLRFDVDLLRVRRVRVALRLQAIDAAVRGVGAAFAVSGSGHDAASRVADVEAVVDVAPRNLAIVPGG
jgi:hypothetical protein